MKEGKLIIGQLGSLLKSRMEGDDHDHHHHHKSSEHEPDGGSSAESHHVFALSSLKKVTYEQPEH